jgi:flagellar biosynthesis GTPase FlhF
MSRHRDKPPKDAQEITTYGGLEWYGKAWSRPSPKEESIGNLILVGPPGLGKTETILKMAGKDRLLLSGMTSPINTRSKS